MSFFIITGFLTVCFASIVFVTNLIGAMKAIKEYGDTEKYIIACSISLMLIVIPIYLIPFMVS